MTVSVYAAWLVILLSLAAACYQDITTKTVYRFLWWIGGVAAMLLLFWNKELTATYLPEFLVFAALQHLLFSRYYGRADCRAFCLCAAALTSLGVGLFGYLIHMLVTFLLLAVVQLFKRNVASDGNLSHPVAFLPYITIAFLLVLWYYYT